MGRLHAPAALLQEGSDRIVHGLGPLYLVRADFTTTTLVRDALGSVRAEVTDAGLVTKAFRYAAYGEIAQATPAGAVPTLLGFAGELRDPSGLVYLRARWYDGGTGRLTIRDPNSGSLAKPVSLNPFAHAAGRPTLLTDPSGLDPDSDDRDPGLGCQKYFLCHVIPVMSPVPVTSADLTALLVPVRGPFGQVILFARGKAGPADRAGASSKGPVPPPGSGSLKRAKEAPTPPGYDPKTWEHGAASRSNETKSYWDSAGGEWIWHEKDRHHDIGHWDYNPWDQWNSPWQRR